MNFRAVCPGIALFDSNQVITDGMIPIDNGKGEGVIGLLQSGSGLDKELLVA